MIDQGVFKNEWTVLAERFGKYKESRVVSQRYYEHLSPRMTTEAFVSAARSLFASEEFFPSPDAFLEAAGFTGTAAAHSDWEHVHAILYGKAEAYDRLTEEGRRTVRLMGGVHGLQSTHVDEAKWRRREFFELYRSERHERESLPPMGEEARRIVGEAAALLPEMPR